MKCAVLWQLPFYILYGLMFIILMVMGSSEFTMDSTRGNGDQLNAIDSNSSTRKHEAEGNSVVTSLEEQLKDDQMALKRMILILSLVGGLGAIAIAITVVIFTKVRKRKQRNNNKTGGPPFAKDEGMLIHDRRSSSIHRPCNMTDRHESVGLMSIVDNEPPSSSLGLLVQPSAPPVALSYSTSSRPSLCRHVWTTMQASMPNPSAPPVKELDKHQTNTTCGLCDLDDEEHHNGSTGLDTAIILSPEIPPPAYTPSAPPLYDSRRLKNTTNLLRR